MTRMSKANKEKNKAEMPNSLTNDEDTGTANLVRRLESSTHGYFEGSDAELARDPPLPDDEYDDLLEELRRRLPNHPLVARDAVGARPDEEQGHGLPGRPVALPFRMGSLDKVKAEDGGEKALRRWAEDGGGRGGESYVLSDKLDGVSALLVIDAKEVSTTPRLYTRGDGKVGRDISHIVPHVSGVLPPPPPPPPAKKKSSVVSSTFAVRGELVIPRREFDAHLRGTRGVNARNLVSGVVNAKTPDATVLRHVRFVAYEVLEPGSMSSARQLDTLLDEFGARLRLITSSSQIRT
jgi:NAD-dependent DNA ligase